MTFLSLTLNGVPTVINLALVISASYDAATRQLYIKFVDAESLMLTEAEAERAWRIFQTTIAAQHAPPAAPEFPPTE